MKNIDTDKKTKLVEKKKVNKKPAILLIIVALLLVAGYLAYSKYYKKVDIQEQGQEMSQKEIDSLLGKVGELIFLPEGVQPAIATVNDAEALMQEQKFFLGAKNGDKILIYKDKALLYDPVAHMLINVGPVIGGEETSSPLSDDVSVEMATNLDIRNGSGVSGAANELAAGFGEGYEIIQTVDAAAEYENTILVSLTGKDASSLENKLGVKAVDTLPEGEKLSIADFVIIIGK